MIVVDRVYAAEVLGLPDLDVPQAGPVIDLFACPGGWDVATVMLGWDVLGVEWDDAACATRDAAGLRTLQADIGAIDPRETWEDWYGNQCPRCGGFGALDPMGGPAHHIAAAATTRCPDCPLWGLIASPPCQAFSMAGDGAGRRAIAAYLAAVAAMGRGETIDVGELDRACDDERGHLVLEPLRWAMDLRPEWIALEQVPTVLPLWEAMATVLRGQGYHTWTGIVTSERYGVPQTRERAILIASTRGPVHEPPATHARYVPRKKREKQRDEAHAELGGLFDAEPDRIVRPEDRGLRPWISMAQALGWEAADLVGFPRLAETESNRANGDVTDIAGVEYRARDLRTASEPAQVVTGKARSWQRWYWRNGNQQNAARRRADEPAPTLHFGHALNSGIEWTTDPDAPWEPGAVDRPGPDARVEYRRGGERIHESTSVNDPAPTVTTRTDRWQIVDTGDVEYDSRGQRDTRSGEPVPARRRTADEPAPTIAGQSRNDSWVFDRPGDPRIAEPGHKRDTDNPDSPGRMTNAVRVTAPEAAVLQSFPANYPWQGTKTKVFEQIGNAVPPLLALHVLLATTRGERT